MLGEIEARGFRNLAPLAWSPGGGVHLVLGANGAGKTSLLEAIYAVATTRSFRTNRLTDCVAHEADSFHLRAEVTAPQRTSLAFQVRGRERQRSMNEKRAPLANYLGALPVIPWTAAEGALISGPPEMRRRFLDRGVVAQRSASIKILARHRQALNAKRQLLLTGGRGLAAWNEVLAEAAAELTRLRSRYCAQLTEALVTVLGQSGMGLPAIGLRYRPSLEAGLEGAGAVAAELAALTSRERRERRPLRGPHRDDIEILWDGHTARVVASAGERKALGLALVAAQGLVLREAGRQPLFLLDDADTELDAERLAGVFRGFGEVEQMIATSNRPHVFERVAINQRWRCTDGHLEQEAEGARR